MVARSGEMTDEDMGVYGVMGHSTGIAKGLNELGADGWKAAAGVASDSGCIHEVLLKRELQTDPPPTSRAGSRL
jgi:hypothetical protein